MKIQFFLGGPFDPLLSPSITFFDEHGEIQDVIVGTSSLNQDDLWKWLLDQIERHMYEFGLQVPLPFG